MARMSIRIDLEPEGRGSVGPGKVRLLELIDDKGSIAAAGRELGMSYRRAWGLIGELNGIFGRPVLEASVGGVQGGGAVLTPFGRELVERYRRIEDLAQGAAAGDLAAIEQQPGAPTADP